MKRFVLGKNGPLATSSKRAVYQVILEHAAVGKIERPDVELEAGKATGVLKRKAKSVETRIVEWPSEKPIVGKSVVAKVSAPKVDAFIRHRQKLKVSG